MSALRIGQCLLLWLITSSLAHAAWYSEKLNVMGTETGVTVEASTQAKAKQLTQKVFNEFKRFDRLYSSYKADSELSLVNQHGFAQTQQLSDEFNYLIQRSLEFYSLSNGLFDITYASVGHQYDYRQRQQPNQQQLKQGLPLIDAKALLFDDHKHTLRFQHQGTRIDLGGIGKGYVVDRAISLLQGAGVEHASVYAGGDRRFLGQHGDRPWIMGIRHPRQADQLALSMPIDNAAVSTSGDYERFFIDDQGQRHHHIIHPKTGDSPKGVVSATVIGDEAMTTDAMSTSVLLAGVKQGMQMIEKIQGLDAIVIDEFGKVYYTSGLVAPSAKGD